MLKIIKENEVLISESDSVVENFNTFLSRSYRKSTMLSKLEKKKENELSFSKLSSYDFDVEQKFNNVIKFVFDINYFAKFRQIKDMIKKYETDFDKALLFNNLSVAYALFEELGKADFQLKELEKLTFEKVKINFVEYVFNNDSYKELESQRKAVLNAL